MHYLLLLILTFSTLATDFDDFLQSIKNQALAKNISTQTLTVLDNITPNPRILELDSRQAEFSLNFWNYINSRVSPRRTLIGGLKIKQNEQMFADIYQKYGVPKHILIAFWGLESNFGVNTGSFNLIRSLSTLAFDKRRRTFFSRELISSLQLIDQGKLSRDTNSSWAGAMGSVQFMPSNVKNYGIDANQDGLIDLWNNEEDIFYSAANFLAHIGWNKGEKWGREVGLPANFDYKLAGLKKRRSLYEWKELGIFDKKTNTLLSGKLEASLILPMGYAGPAFLVYRNFRAILNWNRSTLYALSVGILADKLINQNLISKFTYERNLSKKDVIFIQQKLTNLGLDVGGVDGVSGRKTRNAVRQYQLKNNFPIDGYIGLKLLQQLQ